MDNLLLKTQEIIHLSLLDDGNVIEAIKTFEKYQNHIKTNEYLKSDNKETVLKELNSSVNTFIEKLNNTAKNYMEKEDYNKAAICLSEILNYWSENIYCIINYIICVHKLNQFDIEEEFLEYLQQLTKNNMDLIILKDISKMFARIDKIEQALTSLKDYIDKIDENKITSEDYELLGTYYNELYIKNNYDDLNNIIDSIDNFLKADDLNPTDISVTRKIAKTSSLINNYQLEKIYWDRLFKLCSPTNNDLFEYSTFCMKYKNFKEFNKYFDCRFTKEKKPLILPFEKIEKPKWQGENISDKTLLILYEQGFSDTLLMYGYIPRLVKLAKKVKFIVQDELYHLLKNDKFGIEILKFSTTNIEDIDFDYYIPAMSIISALNLDESNISVGAGYIQADNNLVKTYKENLFNNKKFKIAIAYSGDKNQPLIHHDIPVEEFLPIKELDNIELYSIVKDVSKENKDKLKEINAIDLSENMKSFADTASFIENCDLIISSDNVILNLAGAMGKKTFGLFNWYYEWRWYDLTGEDVGWYSSVKPFVNTSMNDWQSSMTRVVDEIKKLQNNKND